MKKEMIIGLVIVLAVVVYIFFNINDDKEGKVINEASEEVVKEESVIEDKVDEAVNIDEITTYTVEEIESEAEDGKCLISIDSKVYDMTNFPEEHPGGSDKILNNCGKDGTTVFQTKGGKGEHSESAVMRLEDFYIGDLSE